MNILGIETSCDETAAAVISDKSGVLEVLSNVVSSQIEVHKKYGGVVPEVAAREHVLNILPVINEALLSGADSADMGRTAHLAKINAIAVTVGPGLITSLLTGAETAKNLAYALGLPLVAVNHIEGHVYANFIGKSAKPQDLLDNEISENSPGMKFPAVILTVSGGHTMLLLMEGHGKYKILGETRDDAAGEAFDKAAKLMGIGYPGGPVIATEAVKFLIPNLPTEQPSVEFLNKLQTPNSELIPNPIKLPRPMMADDNFEFSFSGLKTALRYSLEKDAKWQSRIPEYCYEFQRAVVEVLVAKTVRAVKRFDAKTVMLAGGVSANNELRKEMTERIAQELPMAVLHIPDLKYTTDNAAMVAAAGYFKALRGEFTDWKDLKVDCNLKLA